MLVIDDLDEATVERAGALVAREHAAARRLRPELPVGFDSADVCAAALQRLCDSGHRGLLATDNGRTVAVMTATVRQNLRRPLGGYERDPPGITMAPHGSPLARTRRQRDGCARQPAPRDRKGAAMTIDDQDMQLRCRL